MSGAKRIGRGWPRFHRGAAGTRGLSEIVVELASPQQRVLLSLRDTDKVGATHLRRPYLALRVPLAPPVRCCCEIGQRFATTTFALAAICSTSRWSRPFAQRGPFVSTAVRMARMELCGDLSGAEWSTLKASYPVGTEVQVAVIADHEFGIFVDFGVGPLGLILIVNFPEKNRGTPLPRDPSKWPKIGEPIRGRILGFRDYSQQVEMVWIS